MTPYEIELILNIYTSGSVKHEKTPLLARTMDRFCRDNVIKVHGSGLGWELDRKGEACVRKLCNVDYANIKFCSECGKEISND